MKIEVKLSTSTEMHKELYASIHDIVQKGMMVLNIETVGKGLLSSMLWL